jgi:hypothetical protein
MTSDAGRWKPGAKAQDGRGSKNGGAEGTVLDCGA